MHTYIIQHHGIKGMKWGVRRFQNPDGSLTEAGKQRYDVGENGKYKRVKRSEQLRRQYEESGLSKEDAELAAKRRATAEKVLLGVGAVALTAAVAYVAYKHYDESVDKVIRSGKTMKRLAGDTANSVHDGAYVAFKKVDTEDKYVGIYGRQKLDRGQRVFQKTLVANRDIRIASRKSGQKILSRLAKSDPEFRNQLEEALRVNEPYLWGKQGEAFRKGLSSLRAGKVDKNTYDAFNLLLVDHKSPMTAKFRQAVKDAGYGAIEDMNDKRLSGFDSKRPIILLRGTDVTVKAIKKIGWNEVRYAENTAAMHEGVKLVRDGMLKLGGLTAIGAGAAAASVIYDNENNNAVVTQYRRDHPNSKLTYDEIIENYYRSG